MVKMVIKTQSGAVEFISESVTSMYHSRVLVYEGGQLVAEVIAEIVQGHGFDGGLYSRVMFERKI